MENIEVLVDIVRSHEMFSFRSAERVFGCSDCGQFFGQTSQCVTLHEREMGLYTAWIRPLYITNVYPIRALGSGFVFCRCGAAIGKDEGGTYYLTELQTGYLPFDTSRSFGLVPRLLEEEPKYDFIMCKNETCNRFFGLNSSLTRTDEGILYIPCVFLFNAALLREHLQRLICICGTSIGRIVDLNIARLHTYNIVSRLNFDRIRESTVPSDFQFQDDVENFDNIDSEGDDSGFENDTD